MMTSARALSLIEGATSALDTVLVGQAQAKCAMLIGLLAREHVLLEGAPGCGKSELATSGLRLFGAPDELHLYSFHRDTRREDLLGATHLVRELSQGRERLSFGLEPGALLRAPMVVLENLERAPGEALAPLLQLLGSRTADLGRGCTVSLPLETAVATTSEISAVPSETSIGDPLEPSQLDRFSLQVRMNGLISERRWGRAREVIDRQFAPCSARGAVLESQDRNDLQDWVQGLEYPAEVQARVGHALESLARRVRAVGSGTGRKALLSDRVFGAVLPKLLRSHAASCGRLIVQVEDMRVLQLVVAQRFPEELLGLLDEVLEEALSTPTAASEPNAEGLSEQDDSLPMVADGDNEQVASDAMPGQIPGGPTTEADLPEAPVLPPRRRRPRAADVEPLIRAFEGRLDRGRSDLDDDPGGQPRGFRPMRRFDELIDADPLDALLLVDGKLAGLPRVLRRRRKMLGGAVVIARDVSSSMAGFRNDWASELICGLVKASARRRMRVGYLEFHQRAMPRLIGGRLLHRKYEQLNQVVREARPMGQTNYEAPLRTALDALRGRRGRNRHVVMLTDGLPILGDTQVRSERALAKKLGVSLHTVFIGDGESPPVLDAISLETEGLRFQAVESAGALVLRERVGSGSVTASAGQTSVGRMSA